MVPVSNSACTAKRFATCNNDYCPPIPVDHPSFQWTDFASHYNCEHVSSPLISTTNSFFFALRLAFKASADARVGGRICIIDRSKLPRNEVYHAEPFVKESKRKLDFTDGRQRYPGSTEFSVWGRIPATAIMHDFAFSDLIRLGDDNPTIKSALRFSLLEIARASYKTLSSQMDASKIDLNADVVTALAQVCDLVDLNHRSDSDHISGLLGDMIGGCRLSLEPKSRRDWLHIAGVFEQALSRNDHAYISLRERAAVQQAFLEGIQ